MECTPEEIAEKRRIALERLKAKKEAMAKATKESTVLSTSKHISTNPYQDARIRAHPYASKVSSTATYNVSNQKEQTVPIPCKVIVTCSCYMISESRFEVKPSAFNNKLIDVFKTFPSRSYGRNRLYAVTTPINVSRFQTTTRNFGRFT